LFNENGEHPRRTVSGQVYTPVFYPPDKHLLWHNENSFNYRWPTKIWFCCLTPAQTGGETPLVNSRRVYELIDPSIRRRFEERGIMYVRNYGTGLGLDWQTVFQSGDQSEVERRCREAQMTCEWKSGARLKTSCVRPAAVKHPRSGESVWFNQAQHWHVSCLDPEDRYALTNSFAPDDLPRSCYYGDGSPIEDSVMSEILAVYQQLEVVFPWQRGDIVLLDNLLTAHGRNSFAGEREMLVAMGAMMSYEEVVC
jgi:alpha-ketoglutarate-dependent taurine dioxygenase